MAGIDSWETKLERLGEEREYAVVRVWGDVILGPLCYWERMFAYVVPLGWDLEVGLVVAEDAGVRQNWVYEIGAAIVCER